MNMNSFLGQGNLDMNMGMNLGQVHKQKKIPNPQNYKIVKCINFQNSKIKYFLFYLTKYRRLL